MTKSQFYQLCITTSATSAELRQSGKILMMALVCAKTATSQELTQWKKDRVIVAHLALFLPVVEFKSATLAGNSQKPSLKIEVQN